ncbi:MAG: aspartate 1-decarboxylase [Alphaproteobacteria bacterium]
MFDPSAVKHYLGPNIAQAAFWPGPFPTDGCPLMRWILRSKIHKATVTEADLSYIGSITLDPILTDAVGIIAGEKVLVVDNTNGARLETYVLLGERGSGVVCINGAAAHLIHKGDDITILGFELADGPIEPLKVLVGEDNRIIRRL